MCGACYQKHTLNQYLVRRSLIDIQCQTPSFEPSFHIDAKVFTLLPFFLFCFSFDWVRIFLFVFFCCCCCLFFLFVVATTYNTFVSTWLVFFPRPKTKNLIKFPTIGFRKTFKAHSKYYPLTTLFAARKGFFQSLSA